MCGNKKETKKKTKKIKKKIMSRRPKCDELRRAANSGKWSEMLVFYCLQSAGDDIQMAQQMNRLCGRLNAITRERLDFIEELESVGNMYAQKMAEFLREIQRGDNEKVARMQILTAELELNARNKDLFVQKLKGLMDF